MRYNGAILSIADLKRRCRVTDDCWKWGGATDKDRAPSIWCRDLGNRTSMGVLICFLLTGHKPPKGYRWFVTCNTPHCGNPEHRKEGTHSEAAYEARSKKTRKFSELGKRRISIARRKAPTKLDQESATEILNSSETCKVLAEKWGVATSTIVHIKNGRIWRPIEGASVFTWRPA